jgi:polysaccharide chain length determinant protein (PEP-CTERM system associated)
MSEELEEQQAQQFDIDRVIGIIRRHHIQFLVPLFVGWIAVWGASWFLPARYKSNTLILVEQPTMPKNYVEPNVSDDLQERLQSITQQILSRTRLLLIIDKLHLYGDERRHLAPDEKVAQMRKDIEVDLVRNPQDNAISAFRVSFSASDPHIAQEVTSELTNLFIDENSRVREQQSEQTTEFIETQLSNARASLADQEAKVRAFQSAHEGALPTQQASNLQILSGLQAQLQNEQDALNSAKQQKIYTQSLVDQYRTVHQTTRTATGAPTGLEAIDQQLDTLRAKLADLSTRYTDRYPEVQQLKAEIVKTEKEREDAIASLKSNASHAEHGADSQPQTVSDPVQNGPLLQMQGQLRAAELEISNRDQAIASLKSRINEYQAHLSDEPAVEQQLADLSRGYDQSKANYDDLLKKESDSQMATSMEHMQEGEHFVMLDPPSLPLKPDSPNRLKMCGAGIGAGMALGLAVVLGLEFFDDRLHSDKEIRNLLPVAVIAEIPQIVSPSDEQREKRKVLLGWLLAGLVFITIVTGTAFSYLRG